MHPKIDYEELAQFAGYPDATTMFIVKTSQCRMSLSGLAEYLGVSVSAISTALERYGIKERCTILPYKFEKIAKEQGYKNAKDMFKHLYEIEKLSIRQISMLYQCSMTTIRNKFIEYNIKIHKQGGNNMAAAMRRKKRRLSYAHETRATPGDPSPGASGDGLRHHGDQGRSGRHQAGVGAAAQEGKPSRATV